MCPRWGAKKIRALREPGLEPGASCPGSVRVSTPTPEGTPRTRNADSQLAPAHNVLRCRKMTSNGKDRPTATTLRL
jgi:hypothetical protein